MTELRINQEYAKLVPPLPNQDYEELKKSIQTDGLYYPIIINQDGYILDGHNRRKAWMDIGKEEDKLPTKTRKYDDKLEEKKFVILSNLRRRQLQLHEKLALVDALHEIEQEQKKNLLNTVETKVSTVKKPKRDYHREDKNRKKRTPIINKKYTENKSRTRVAKTQHVSDKSLERWQYVKEKAKPEVVEKMKGGWLSPTKAYNDLKSEEKSVEIRKKTIEFPQGLFDVIYVDPPWEFKIPKRSDSGNEYPTMTIDEIKNMDIHAADDAVLFLWTTNPNIPDALDIIKKWEFELKANAVWVKDKIGLGYYFRNQHEILFLATKGEFPTPADDRKCSSVIEAPRTEHSKKPEIVYDMIERMYPNRAYLELFARKKRDGWTSWGNEIT